MYVHTNVYIYIYIRKYVCINMLVFSMMNAAYLAPNQNHKALA